MLEITLNWVRGTHKFIKKYLIDPLDINITFLYNRSCYVKKYNIGNLN